LFDDRGNQLESPPSTPVEILGMEGLPQSGDQFVVVATAIARGISIPRTEAREAALARVPRVSLEGLAEQIKTAAPKNSTSFSRVTYTVQSKC
jgi:translation initiation factor IF-2